MAISDFFSRKNKGIAALREKKEYKEQANAKVEGVDQTATPCRHDAELEKDASVPFSVAFDMSEDETANPYGKGTTSHEAYDADVYVFPDIDTENERPQKTEPWVDAWGNEETANPYRDAAYVTAAEAVQRVYREEKNNPVAAACGQTADHEEETVSPYCCTGCTDSVYIDGLSMNSSPEQSSKINPASAYDDESTIAPYSQTGYTGGYDDEATVNPYSGNTHTSYGMVDDEATINPYSGNTHTSYGMVDDEATVNPYSGNTHTSYGMVDDEATVNPYSGNTHMLYGMIDDEATINPYGGKEYIPGGMLDDEATINPYSYRSRNAMLDDEETVNPYGDDYFAYNECDRYTDAKRRTEATGNTMLDDDEATINPYIRYNLSTARSSGIDEDEETVSPYAAGNGGRKNEEAY